MKKIYISKNLKYLRNQKNVTQRKMAQDINVNRSCIARWETESSVPDIYDIARLMEYFNVENEDIIYTDLEEKENEESQLKQITLLLKECNIVDENDNMTKEEYYAFIEFINSSYKLFRNK